MHPYFKILQNTPLKEMVEREGFEPSIELQTLYSLSRGAPSATRTPLRLVGRIIKISENMSNTFLSKVSIWLQNTHMLCFYIKEA